MSGCDELDSMRHERNRHARHLGLIGLLVVLLLSWLVIGILYMSAKANRILAQEAQARAMQSNDDAQYFAGLLKSYVQRDLAMQNWDPKQGLPSVPGLASPRK